MREPFVMQRGNEFVWPITLGSAMTVTLYDDITAPVQGKNSMGRAKKLPASKQFFQSSNVWVKMNR